MQDIIEIKQAIGHGNFLPWIEAEFSMTERTAQRFMQAAEAGAEYDTMSDLPPSILYALAASSTPEAVPVEVMRGVEAATACHFPSAS